MNTICLIKQTKNILTIILCIYIFTNTITEQKAYSAPKKKKLYISSIKAKGVPTVLADRMRSGIKLAIFENYGKLYQVLDDEAIKVMYKQAAAIMASGCDDESCVTQIADGINADEVVYGDLSSDQSKIRINITCLERKGVSLSTKSIVRLNVFNSQLDFAASEAAKKIINPDYTIDMSKAPTVPEEVRLGGIEIKAVKRLDISVIQFRSDDEAVSRITHYLKTLVSEGDEYFKKGDHSEARDKYLEIVEKVKTKLSNEKQVLVKDYVDGIHKRIDSTYIMEFKPRIDRIDSRLNAIKNPEDDDLEDGLEKYAGITEDIHEIKSPYDASRNQLLSAINDRNDSIYLALLSSYEKNGDSYYHDYKFTDSMKWWASIVSSDDGMTLAVVDNGGADSNGGYIYISTNGGKNWAAQTSAGERFWVSIACSSDGTRFVAGENGGYIYTGIDLY